MEELTAFQGMPGPTRFYLQQVTRLHNAPPALLVIIQHGGNDLIEDRPSLGPVGGFPSSSPEGMRDNFQGIINWLRGHWIALGYDPANLFFMLGPYHPRGDREDVQLAYAQQWADMAANDPQIFSVSGLALTTSTQLAQRGWLASPTDANHLSVDGFRTLGQATVRALSLAACRGDHTADGTLSIDDVFVFLADWFAQTPRADADFSGAIAIDDIFVFLNAWFAAC
jgi:lysophospholipase L1-like esterase